MEQSPTFWKRYSLGIVLIALFIAAWAVMTWTDWMQFSSEQLMHHQPADVFGSSGYIWDWGTLTLENWQSDNLGNAAVVILSAYLPYKGSGMSRESDDEIEQALQHIHQTLEQEQPATKARSEV